jgi:hypothetical protein
VRSAITAAARPGGALLSLGVELVEVALARACGAAAGRATGEDVELSDRGGAGLRGGGALLTLGGASVDLVECSAIAAAARPGPLGSVKDGHGAGRAERGLCQPHVGVVLVL